MVEMFTKEKEFKDLIHIVRGQQVMLDSDLAQLYGYGVKQFNQQVKNNANRFPNDFRFQLTENEYDELRSKNLTSTQRGGRRYLPYVFTEQGIYMLLAVLKGKLAETQSIFIIREFKKMRHYLAENNQLLDYSSLLSLSATVMQNKDDIQDIKNEMTTKSDLEKIMDNFIDKDNLKEKLFLDGEVFDAASAYIQIYKQAKKSICLIDDYINVETLNLLSHKQKQVNVTVFTQNKSKDKIMETIVQRFNKQYPTLRLRFTSSIHDRFIVIDYGREDELFYVCGTSSKDAGKKVCTIIQLQDKEKMHLILDKLLESKS